MTMIASTLNLNGRERYIRSHACQNGLSTASRIFTKVLKPVFAALRKIGHSNVAYIDDSLLQSDTYNQCLVNIKDTMNLIDSVGLTVHPERSVITPSVH